MRLKFTSFEVTLLKGKWYKSNSTRKTFLNLVVDECGLLCLNPQRFLHPTAMTMNLLSIPSMWPNFFFVANPLNRGRILVAKTELRAKHVYCKSTPTSVEMEDGTNDNRVALSKGESSSKSRIGFFKFEDEENNYFNSGSGDGPLEDLEEYEVDLDVNV